MKHIIVSCSKLAYEKTGDRCRLPESRPAPDGESYEFTRGGQKYCAYNMEEIPEGLASSGLRELWGYLDEDDYNAAGKGMELATWDSTTRYCGVCGAKMERCTEISKRCTECGREIFPQVSPAVIVLIKRGEESLLVHARTFSRPFFGLVAGFVETGESLEECVAREILEETSLKVKNVKYFGSQSWPFPAQLMVGFTAEYDSGELKFADGELTEGGFFSKNNLPMIPSPPSIARKMIDNWIKDGI